VNPVTQTFRNLIPALAGDDQLQLGLEIERLKTGRTLLQVMLDIVASLLGELSIEKVVQRMNRFLAVGLP
jgi:hypothetical protein